MSGQRIALWTIALVAILAAVGYRASVMREPPPPPPAKLVFVTGGSGPYWQMTVNGAKAAARKFKADVRIEMPHSDESVEQQTAMLTGLDKTNLDGIAVSPLDAGGQTELISGLAHEMIVVTFDSDAPDSDRQSHVGTSNFSAGRACARLVNDALPDGGKIAVLLANSTKENLIDRKGAFQERINQYADDAGEGKGAKFTIVGFFEDNGNDEKCAENIKGAVTKDPDLACFVGMNARHGPILLRVLKDLGKLDQIKLITFDTADETLDGIEAGHIYATLAQDPYGFGYEAVRILSTLANGDPVEVPIVGKGSVYSGVDVVRQSNLEKFRVALRDQQQTPEQRNRAAGKEAAGE